MFRLPCFPVRLHAIAPVLVSTALSLVLAGCALPTHERTAAQSGLGTVTVLAAGDLRGEIKPCGCSPEGQRGGLPRRLTYLERTQAANPATLLLDLGNNFPTPSQQGRLKIELIQNLLAHHAPAAVLLGPHEVAFGAAALAADLPYLASNATGWPGLLHERTVERGGLRIGLYGYLSPTLVYQGNQTKLRLTPAGDALLAGWRHTARAARQQRRVLLFRGTDAELARFQASGFFDLIVSGNNSDNELEQVTERRLDGIVVPQVPTKGQGLLRLPLPTAGQPMTAGLAVDWLSDTLPDHPAAVAAFKTYDAEVKALFFAHLQTAQEQRKASPYAGVEACATCHAPEVHVWEITRHAHALATLEGVGKQFDPECLACHVVGLDKGGFLSADLTPGLANVQCENCHGPGKAHAANPSVKPGPVPTVDGSTAAKPGPATCRTCHHGSHSPTFAFERYWPKIAHGKAAAAK